MKQLQEEKEKRRTLQGQRNQLVEEVAATEAQLAEKTRALKEKRAELRLQDPVITEIITKIKALHMGRRDDDDEEMKF